MKRFLVAVAVLSFPLLAASQGSVRVGDWLVNVSEKRAVISVGNDSNVEFGAICDRAKGDCLHYIMGGPGCKEGITAPILINGADAQGVLSTKMHCVNLHGENVMVLNDYVEVRRLVAASPNVGIAYAVEGGSFRVSRFNTAKYESAIDAFIRINQATGVRRDTRDVSL